MPKVNGRPPSQDEYLVDSNTQLSSVLYGFVMVAAIIVAGAALLGGSLGQLGQRWSGAVDDIAQVTGLSLERVELIGLEHRPETARQIRLAVMVEPGENMFRANPHAIRRRVEATRLVSNVSVYRLWPDTVMIYANAVEPVALWQNPQGWQVIDSLGRVSVPTHEIDPESLLKTVSDDVPGTAPILVHALHRLPHLAEKIDHAARIGARRWDLILENGTLIQLPGDAYLGDALDRLAALDAAASLTDRNLEKIDLRLAKQVYLKPSRSIEIEEAA